MTREPLLPREVYRNLQAVARRLINILWSNGGEVADVEVPQGRIVVVREPVPEGDGFLKGDPGYKVARLGSWYGFRAFVCVPRESA